MLRGLVLAMFLTACACPAPPAPPPDSGTDAGAGGGTGGGLAPCLDRPTDLPRPEGQLPCEMFPPGFKP